MCYCSYRLIMGILYKSALGLLALLMVVSFLPRVGGAFQAAERD